ncbi:MAG TPA: hypothetical protein VFZ65_23860, partial [Planctomycetota bacterium]|nr:hypothetical protein [Planctomycetota bacterium]
VVTPWRRGAVGDELDARCAVTSGADGRFRLHGVADAVTWVLVEAAGYTAGKHALQPGRDAVLALRGR